MNKAQREALGVGIKFVLDHELSRREMKTVSHLLRGNHTTKSLSLLLPTTTLCMHRLVKTLRLKNVVVRTGAKIGRAFALSLNPALKVGEA